MRFRTLLLASCCIAGHAYGQVSLAVSIVPSQSYATERRISTAASRPDVFYVVITNVSDQPHAVWALGNSWGFCSLSFELSLRGRPALTLFPKPQRFTTNGPNSFLIPPHEHQVFPVRLDDTWQNRPTFGVPGDEPVTLRAIYEVGPSPEAAQYSVWVGRVVSQPYSLTLNHR